MFRFKFVGRDWFLAFQYNPHALQIVSPAGERRHNGVRVVPQLLQFVNEPGTTRRVAKQIWDWSHKAGQVTNTKKHVQFSGVDGL